MQEGEQHDFRQYQASSGEYRAFTSCPCSQAGRYARQCQRLGNGTSAPTAQYLIALAQLFHTTTDDILGLESQEQIVLRGMNEQEKRLVYDLVAYIAERKEESTQSQK